MSSTNKFIVVITTADKPEIAKLISDTLVSERLAACVQTQSISSCYMWKGTVANEQELLLLIKTRAELFDQVEAAIKRVHTYETPEIVALPIEAGSAEYLHWMQRETKD